MRPALLAALALLFSACTATAPPSAPPAVTLGPLKIGILVPFTESAIDADIGASQRRAADLYLKLRDGKLAGREVQLVYDDESALDPATNSVRIEQFLDRDHVELLMGGVSAAAATLLRDASEKAKLIYLDTNASANSLSRGARSRFVFRVAPSSWQLGEPLGEWAAKNGQKDVFVVNADDAFGTETAAAFVDGLAKGGGAASGRRAVPEKGGADWKKVVAEVRAQPAKSVFASLVTDDAEGFLLAWDAAGMRAAGYRLIGPGPLADGDVLKATKQAGLGVTTTSPWSAELENAANAAFVSAFEKAYQDEDTHQPLVPDGYAAEMWDAMAVLEHALADTKGDVRNAEALVAAIEKVSFDGPGGPVRFDPATHARTEDVYVREVRQAGGRLVQAVVDKIPSVKDPSQ